MKVVKQNKMKLQMSKISSHNVSKVILIKFNKLQKNVGNNKKFVHSTTINNTNNNSLSSIKGVKNQKNNLFNTKMASFKQKTYLKEYAINQKMYLYKKNNESTHLINNKDANSNFPIDLLNKHSNNKYVKYYNKNKNNMNNNMNNNYINNNKNINTSINSNNKSINLSKKPFNKSGISKNNFIYYNSKNKNKKSTTSFTNSNTNANNSISYNYNNYSNAAKINKMNKITQAANPVNTYIINTLNVSEKDFINSGLKAAKPEKVYDNSAKDLQNEINKLIKEKEENKSLIKKQKKLIEKFEEDNDNLESRINAIIHENKKIKSKIETYTENQEQLIMLIKIVQKSGVDVESLIDKWNNEVENMNEEKETSDNKESISDEINELNSKIDPSSFIPINIEEPHVNKKVFKGIPKLNFSNINNKENKKPKFKNNSKQDSF